MMAKAYSRNNEIDKDKVSSIIFGIIILLVIGMFGTMIFILNYEKSPTYQFKDEKVITSVKEELGVSNIDKIGIVDGKVYADEAPWSVGKKAPYVLTSEQVDRVHFSDGSSLSDKVTLYNEESFVINIATGVICVMFVISLILANIIQSPRFRN